MSEVAQLISQTLEQERRQRELLERHYAQYDADDDEVGTTALPLPAFLPCCSCVTGSLPFPKEGAIVYTKLKFNLVEKECHFDLIVSSRIGSIPGVCDHCESKSMLTFNTLLKRKS